MTEEEKRAKNLERKQLARQLVYTSMPNHQEVVARHGKLVDELEAERKREEALTGINLEERRLLDSQAMVEANQRMAEAAERSAVASAAAARWAGVAAIFAALSVLIPLVQSVWSLPRK